jgi:hypothetical protein
MVRIILHFYFNDGKGNDKTQHWAQKIHDAQAFIEGLENLRY